LLEKLHRAHAVAGDGVHESAAAAVLAALESARDHEAVVFDIDVRLGDGHEEPPIVGASRYGRFAKFVDLIDAT
jgi:hypothetical protein